MYKILWAVKPQGISRVWRGRKNYIIPVIDHGSWSMRMIYGFNFCPTVKRR